MLRSPPLLTYLHLHPCFGCRSVAVVQLNRELERAFGHFGAAELASRQSIVQRELADSRQELNVLMARRNQLSTQERERGRSLQNGVVPRLEHTLNFLERRARQQSEQEQREQGGAQQRTRWSLLSS